MNFVSIIIPTYNRADLIGETLDSILAQTYKNWECLIVDDHSSDNTQAEVSQFTNKDSRIQYHLRPGNRPKGANSCRNYGFELSKGEFINWFDSDDLMHPDFIKEKLNCIKKDNADFVISKTLGFAHPKTQDIKEDYSEFYTYEQYPVTHYNYVSQLVNWLTYDFFCKRALVADLRFNEHLMSAQEYNFFCQVTLKSVNCRVLDQVLTLRRLHANSITVAKEKTTLEFNSQYFRSFYETFKDLHGKSDRNSLFFLYKRQQALILNQPMRKSDYFRFIKLSYTISGFESVLWLVFYLYTQRITNRGYFLRSKYSKKMEQYFECYKPVV